jgi:hypothetical protein
MDLGPNAHVDGGIHVRKSSGWSLSFGSEDVPRIVICPVQGATVVKYSGARPPD